ncbi:MAG: N-acetyltransferase DgcN [Alphaproteobacteria bacterium]
MDIKAPYLLFLGDAPDALSAKTAAGIAYWRPEICVGQLRLADCQTTVGLKDITLEEAKEAGVRTMVIGVANRGGVIPKSWVPTMLKAMDLGFDLASGLHTRLSSIAEVAAKARDKGRALHDARHPTREFEVGTGERRSGRRLLTVGTDCSIGKMYASLAIANGLRQAGANIDFRATGQTGILIDGRGVSVDAVVSDFISGAVEWLAPANDAKHWDVIEGQGSLFHPSYAGVSLGLLHGAQPDALILCHEPTRPHMRGLPGRKMPDLRACLDLNVQLARLTSPTPVLAGICVNTSHMHQPEGADYCRRLAEEFGVPAVDPVRDSVAPLIDHLQKAVAA